MTHAVYADIVEPAARIPRAVYNSALVAGFSLLVALSAQVAIPLPFTPVPVTLQTLMVLATGALLGSRRGAAAILLYIVEGAAGLPVFAMGRSGPAHLAGPLGGYLVGFVAAAFLAGLVGERGWDRSGLLAFAGLMVADLAIYVPGLLWLGAFTGFPRVLVQGALPFLVADVLKAAACASLLPVGWRFLAGTRGGGR
jgi:biotin transport system substrate-specific component